MNKRVRHRAYLLGLGAAGISNCAAVASDWAAWSVLVGVGITLWGSVIVDNLKESESKETPE